MTQRFIGAVVALGLLLLGPVPMSACAMLKGMMADCAPAAPASGESKCGQMAMHHPEEQVSGTRLTDCCKSNAPTPPALPSAKTVVAPEFAVEPLVTNPSPLLMSHAVPVASTPSPPDAHERQSLLCVFLI